MSDTTSIERNPVYQLLTDKTVQNFLFGAGDPVSSTYLSNLQGVEDEDYLQLFKDLDIILDTDAYTINQNHELFHILDTPHIERVICDAVALATLLVHIEYSYVACLTVEAIAELTPFSETEIEAAVDKLESLRFLKRTLVADGNTTPKDLVEDAERILNSIDTLAEALDEKTTVTPDELESITGEMKYPESNSPDIITMTREQLTDAVQQAATHGTIEFVTDDQLGSPENGEHGTTLHKQRVPIQEFKDLSITMLSHSDQIQETC